MEHKIDFSKEIEQVKNNPGIDISLLKPETQLVISTKKDIYQIRVVNPETYDIEFIGGKHISKPEHGTFIGSTLGGSIVKLGWIVLGANMEIQLPARVILRTTVVYQAKIIGDGWEYDAFE